MQGLVHIGLWHGDIVLEPARNGFVHFMDHTQGRITVLHRIHNDPHCKNIVDLVQGLVLVHHLLINTKEVLHPAADLTFDLRMLHVGADLLDDLVDEILSGLAGQGYLFLEIIINVRLQVFQRQIVQLDLYFGNTKTVRQRRVDLDGLSGLFLLFLRLHVLKCPHVVEAVRQLNEDDPDILGHGQEHLS